VPRVVLETDLTWLLCPGKVSSAKLTKADEVKWEYPKESVVNEFRII
jgi:hypothetical protein